MVQTLEHVACNLCGADDFVVVHPTVPQEKGAAGKYAASSGHVSAEQVVRCRRCGLVYVNPRPKAEAIVQEYAEADNSTYVSQSEGRLLTFRQGIRLVEQCAPVGSILDVGCAGGFFLQAAKERGWEVCGVEPSQWLVDYAQRELGLENVRQGTLLQSGYPSEYFDVVTFWDVLEHTADPTAELREAWRILKPGGLLLVNYPDFDSMWAKLLGRRWWFLLSVHLFYFTPRTLAKMLEKNDFRPLGTRMHFQKLSLGYLAYRLRPYVPPLAVLMGKLFGLLRLDNWQVTYYASQTNMLARKG